MTSAEAILVSLQSHSEVLNTLDEHPSLPPSRLREAHTPEVKCDHTCGANVECDTGKVFVASVSPQVRASLAATYGVSEKKAGWMMDQLLSGPDGLRSGGKYRNGFTWVVDTNAMREACLVVGADEVMDSLSIYDVQEPISHEGASATKPKKPILTSACPGWICYAEKTHPHILPHLSRLKSPQALTGTLLKTVLSERLHIPPDRIWHVAIMPCFDKKLEASREELTDVYWHETSPTKTRPSVRDVDCVITARELLMLAETRGISFPSLPRRPLSQSTRIPFPDPKLNTFLFPPMRRKRTSSLPAGSSGGYLHHLLLTQQSLHPGSTIHTTRGRNPDVMEYILEHNNAEIFKAARYYGFRNIQNLVRKLKPTKKSRLPGGTRSARAAAPAAGKSGADFAYVEVMACPGGCTNGGGQIKVEDIGGLNGKQTVAQCQKEWLAKVDEAYFSMSDPDDEDDDDQQDDNEDTTMNNHTDVNMLSETRTPEHLIDGISPSYVRGILDHWAASTGIEVRKLVFTSFREVESSVGREGGGMERVVELAGKIGGGW